jgi:hypothetical protein
MNPKLIQESAVKDNLAGWAHYNAQGDYTLSIIGGI